MTNRTWTVSADFQDEGEAKALAEIISELGVKCTVHYETEFDFTKRNSDTRLGRALVASMEANRSYTIEHFMIVCQENDYSKLSAASVLSRLARDKRVVKITAGLWRLPKEGEL